MFYTFYLKFLWPSVPCVQRLWGSLPPNPEHWPESCQWPELHPCGEVSWEWFSLKCWSVSLSQTSLLLAVQLYKSLTKFWRSNERQRMLAEFQTCIIPVSLLASIIEIMHVDGRMAAMTSSTITWPVFGEAGTNVTPTIHSDKKIKHYCNIHCDPGFPPAYYWSANLENKLCIQTVESYLNLISSNNNITFKKIFWLYWRFLPLQSVPARVWRRRVLGLTWWNAAGAPCLGSHCVTSLDPSGSI